MPTYPGADRCKPDVLQHHSEANCPLLLLVLEIEDTDKWFFLLLGVGCKNKQLMVRGRHFNVFTLLFFKKDLRYSVTETNVHMKTNEH